MKVQCTLALFKNGELPTQSFAADFNMAALGEAPGKFATWPCEPRSTVTGPTFGTS